MKITYVDHMGDDDSVVNAARVSFHKEANHYSEEQNTNLIKYLAKHKHEIPFAHTAISLRVKAPISIRTQAFKHKIGFVENEVSRRYVTEKPEIYIPTFRVQAPNKKQGSLNQEHESNFEWQDKYIVTVNRAIEVYEDMLKAGIPAEQARFILPQGVITEWIWTGSLLAYARFYNLRSKPDAQKEIQELAQRVSDIIEPLFPISWKVLTQDEEKKE